MASLEAMLFAAGDPVEPGKLAEVLDVDVENVIKMLGHLEAMYDENNRGLRLIRGRRKISALYKGRVRR